MNKQAGKKAIELKGVSFCYQGGNRAIDLVDFYVANGEFAAVLAPNGSGKTTLLKLLVKLLIPQEGEIYLNGTDIDEFSKNDLFQRIGLVLQNPNDQLFAATVEEDVAFGPRNLGLTDNEVEERVDRALHYVGAEKLRERAIHQLSFGEQKRVSLAGVLAMHPSVLVLDEPTAGLDPSGEARMLRLLHRLNKDHDITIVMATHSVDMLPLFVDRIYVLKNGFVLKEGAPQVVFNDREAVDSASLRLPYISQFFDELKIHDGVPVNGLPLTIREARLKMMELIPPEIIIKPL